MAQLEGGGGGGHCVVRNDWVRALSSLGHWLHCLESPGPGDIAEPTNPSEQQFASSSQTKEGDLWSHHLLARGSADQARAGAPDVRVRGAAGGGGGSRWSWNQEVLKLGADVLP